MLDNLSRPLKILDIGGTYRYWEDLEYNIDDIAITLLNLEKEEVHAANISSVKGDAVNLSVYKDKEFDIVFSNSVIEHLHNFENQIKMSKETMRVGKYYYIQTPNKYFPIEPHMCFPFIQFFPYKLVKYIMMNTKLVLWRYHSEKYIKRYYSEIKLLSHKQLRKLFPDSKIYKERFCGLTKSLTATNL